MIKRYSSTAALRADFIARCGASSRFHDRSRDAWFGNESTQDTLRKAELGDMTLVPQAEAQLARLDQVIETPRKIWERAPAGAFCSVPDHLAGLPTPMRRQAYVPDETAPISILVDTTSSQGISAATLRDRGITILAFVMALSRVRPTTLHQLATLDGTQDGETVITSEINTHPLDLATACYVLTSAGFARRLTYGLGEALNNFSGGWPRGYRFGKSTYYDALKLRLGLEPKKCLIIPAAELGDELLRQPIVWINKQIQHFTQAEEELVA